MAKKTIKNTTACCPPGHNNGMCVCKGLLAILILVLVWLPSIAATWSKTLITIAAALILVANNRCFCRK